MRKHPLSVSATDLSKLGQCEFLVIVETDDTLSSEIQAASRRGDAEHDRFHRRAVLNAGNRIMAKQL